MARLFPSACRGASLTGDSIIELLVVVPFRLEKSIKNTSAKPVIAGVPGVVKRMVSGARQHLPQPTIVICRFQLKVRVAERIDHKIANVPCCDPESIQSEEIIDNGQRSEQPNVEDQLFRERKGDRRKKAVQMALVMLKMNPMQRPQMEGAMRAVVPNLGPDRRQKRRIEKRGETGILKKTKLEESRQDDCMDRRMKRIPHLPFDLLRRRSANRISFVRIFSICSALQDTKRTPWRAQAWLSPRE